MRALAACVVAVAVVYVSVPVLRAAAPTLPAAEWFADQVRVLSAAEMGGRASGAPGAERAARHIATVFRDAGLQPAGDAGGYAQAFTVPTAVKLGAANALELVAPTRRALRLGRDFTPLAVSDDGTAEGDIVFMGYGITAPDLGYDDYAGAKVEGKIVLALTREPRPLDPASPFRRPDVYHYSESSHKIANARTHGARAILLVSHPATGAETLPALRGTVQPRGILAAAVTRAVADTLLAPSGRTLVDAAAAIDQALAPRSIVAGARVRLTASLVRERGTAANVLGVLRGREGARRDEVIVIGAHYDHLGHGGEGSLAPDAVGSLHPGADDNASGTAAVMGLARAFAAAGGVERTLVFAAFAGEEMGLLGSAHYVKRPPLPLERTILMVNLDMVGRLRDGKVYVAGVDSGSGLRALVERVANATGLRADLRGDPFAPSDQTSFYTAGRPALFFFTGAHEDYHRPSDTWDKVNAAGVQSVADLVARVVADVSREPAPPAWTRVEAPARQERRGYGPYFGVIPEFGERDRPGVAVSGVRAGSPAEKAGVRAGDVIVRFAGVTLTTLEDFTFALRGKRPGDRVDVRVLRDGATVDVEAVLEERR